MEQQGGRRTIAVTVWGQRVSPVFDAAGTVLIAEIESGVLVNSTYLAFDPQRTVELLRTLGARHVTCLICGAISEGPATLFEAAGIELIAFVAGNVQRVLETVCCGSVLGGEFKMPGCGKHVCCRGRIRKGHEIGAVKSSERHTRQRKQRGTTLSDQTTPGEQGKGGAEETAAESKIPSH